MAVLHMLKSMIDTINTSFILQNGGSTIVIDGGFPKKPSICMSRSRLWAAWSTAGI